MANDQGFLTGRPEREETLVVVFLRGGADGLSMVVPVEDDAYYAARPRLAVAKSGAVKLNDLFSLHPRLQPLKKAYDDGALAIVHGAGSEDTSRSHFYAQDFMEHGGLVAGGWLGRYLRFRDEPARGGLSAVAMAKSYPECLRGAPSAAVMQSFEDFSLGAERQGFVAELAKLYELEKGALGQAASDTLRAMERLERLRENLYRPHGGAAYPANEFGQGLMRTAQLIKARVGLEAVSIDLPGWDTHYVQGQLIETLLGRLADGLAAFYDDLGPAMSHVTVVVMTEFGRRVAENASFGTDHGRGGVMFILGGGVHGGRVIGDWPGLQADNLEGPGDLPVVHNYRDVLAPIIHRLGATQNLDRIFPEYELNPLDLYA